MRVRSASSWRNKVWISWAIKSKCFEQAKVPPEAVAQIIDMMAEKNFSTEFTAKKLGIPCHTLFLILHGKGDWPAGHVLPEEPRP